MKFEDLEDVWTLQRPTSPSSGELETLQRKLMPQLKRPGRLLGLLTVVIGLGLVLGPLLFFFGGAHMRPEDLPLFAGRLVVNQSVYLGLLVYLFRRLLRQRRMAGEKGKSVRHVLIMAEASVRAELADYQRARWIIPLLVGLSLLSVGVTLPAAQFGWTSFAWRAGLIIGVNLPIVLGGWWHCRRILRLEQLRLKALLGELEPHGSHLPA